MFADFAVPEGIFHFDPLAEGSPSLGNSHGLFTCSGCMAKFVHQEDLGAHELWCKKLDKKAVMDGLTNFETYQNNSSGNCIRISCFSDNFVLFRSAFGVCRRMSGANDCEVLFSRNIVWKRTFGACAGRITNSQHSCATKAQTSSRSFPVFRVWKNVPLERESVPSSHQRVWEGAAVPMSSL